MIDHIIAAIQQHAERVVNTMPVPHYAEVSSIDPARHAVRVIRQPEGVLSGWYPMMAHSVGAGWGLSTLPNLGDQVLVLPTQGEHDSCVVLGCVPSLEQLPPMAPATPGGTATNGQAGEFLLRHQSGSYLRFCTDGTVIGSSTMWHLNGPVTVHSGDLKVVDGDVYDKHGSLDRLRGHYDAHKHGNVMPGGGTTSTPLDPNQDPE